MKRTAIKKNKKPPKKKNRVWLKRPTDVRRLLSSTINEVRRGEIEPAVAGKIGYLANILLSALSTIRDEELEERVQALEEKLASELSRGMR